MKNLQVLCGSDDSGAIQYFNAIKSKLDLLIVNDISKVKDLNFNGIITGGSLGYSIDKDLISYSKNINKPCISIIEHWSWYRKRFELNGELILPDFIFVNDEIAYTDAVDDGLPSNKIIIAGNPVLESIFTSGKHKQIDREKLQNQYNLPKKRIIFFISEELASEFNGTDDELGYDEFLVIKQIISLLKPSDHLVIKLHPEESNEKYQYLKNKQLSIIKNIDIYSLNALADIVIGMASMLLLELAMLRNDIISFRPNASKKFIGDRLSATLDVTSKEGLKSLMNFPKVINGDFRRQFNGSSEKISSLIKEIF
tara:strand:+ start:2014 stop:2949 length:936 start_codon:yes stop_codon:yes gene_type:complete